jgi:outer membrane receptor protein involved in Fe transport
MKAAGIIIALATISAATSGPANRASSPPVRPAPSVPISSSIDQLPMLFVVDGVRYSGDQVPLLSAELVATVQVIKGHRALEQYGPDASYGVVIITTKLASARRS